MIRKSILLFVFLIAAIFSGCSVEPTSKASGKNNRYDLDLRFREFYDWLGGEDVLGPVISTKFDSKGYEYQYTAAALLVFIPNAADNQRYQLAPLGLELGLAEPPMSPDSTVGHEIYPGFFDFYTQIGGARYTGDPITDAHYNAEKGRIEQHFENLGFYHPEDDVEGVHLLHYGAWKCGNICGYDSPDEAKVVIWSTVGSSFDAAVRRLDPSFTGYPLTEPYSASDGFMEQIFENVVIIADVSNPGNIQLRPIIGVIGLPVQEPGDYYVPEPFLEYIHRNSGLEFTGQPLTEYAALSSEVYRQCFTNLCLDYFPNASKGYNVRPAPLGYTYKSLYYEPGVQKTDGEAISEITIRVWETYPLVTNHQNQRIGVRLESGNEPLENFIPILTLVIPGSGELKYTFPPTNQDGTTYLELDPIDVVNGTRIEYKVCVGDQKEDNNCIVDDFMIWAE